jgi:hypothetical protein
VLDEALDEICRKTGKSEEEVLLALKSEFQQIGSAAGSLLMATVIALDYAGKVK